MVLQSEIVALQDRMTELWHEAPDALDCHVLASTAVEACGGKNAQEDWLALVARQHRANFDLWHVEDEARAPETTDADLAEVKRRIDATNQIRNDLMEELDRMLLSRLEGRGLPNALAPLHSETPGMIIDRLSILALKIYHTREEAGRNDGPAGHSARNRQRLAILEVQRRDLAACLSALWAEVEEGTRRFKLYRQLKMYNDPSLNPAVYGKSAAPEGR